MCAVAYWPEILGFYWLEQRAVVVPVLCPSTLHAVPHSSPTGQPAQPPNIAAVQGSTACLPPSFFSTASLHYWHPLQEVSVSSQHRWEPGDWKRLWFVLLIWACNLSFSLSLPMLRVYVGEKMRWCHGGVLWGILIHIHYRRNIKVTKCHNSMLVNINIYRRDLAKAATKVLNLYDASQRDQFGFSRILLQVQNK